MLHRVLTSALACALALTLAAAPAAYAAAPLKIGFVYVGPVGDAGWSFANDQGRRALQAHFGARVQTQYVENVPEGPDAERVLRDLVQQGDTLVFATSFGFMESALKVARDNPQVKFEHATGYKTAANLGTYDARTYEGAYMAGMLAGGMTHSNTLGIVGSVPIPEVIRNIDSFTLGAQSVNPKIKVKVVWVNKWFDPPKETEAATALIDQGADVLFQNTDSPAVLQTAEKLGKFGFGWDSDMAKFGPHAQLASAVINWAPVFEAQTQQVLAGSWTVQQSWWGVEHGVIDLVSVSPKVPAALRARVAAVKAGLGNGSFNVWQGPILGQNGATVLAAGTSADDKFLHGINFYVKGVEGQVPGN
jgi:simple sugar transport system substrate-binding protein